MSQVGKVTAWQLKTMMMMMIAEAVTTVVVAAAAFLEDSTPMWLLPRQNAVEPEAVELACKDV